MIQVTQVSGNTELNTVVYTHKQTKTLSFLQIGTPKSEVSHAFSVLNIFQSTREDFVSSTPRNKP